MKHTSCFAFTVLLIFPLATLQAANGPKQQPNILLVVVDDLNVALGCYGDRHARTPNIDRLAARGARFDRAHAQYPLCGPSRVSFLTGRRPEVTGVYVLDTPARTALPDAEQLPEFFQRHGYHTVAPARSRTAPALMIRRRGTATKTGRVGTSRNSPLCGCVTKVATDGLAATSWTATAA